MSSVKNLDYKQISKEIASNFRSVVIGMLEEYYINDYIKKYSAKHNNDEPSKELINCYIEILIKNGTVSKVADNILQDLIKELIKKPRRIALIYDSTLTILTCEVLVCYIVLFIAYYCKFSINNILSWGTLINSIFLLVFYIIAYIIKSLSADYSLENHKFK
ncbi:MAG: hypothetical protein K9K32_07080 [Halanaerobiales bacterium]|nr:hypothetical protein [Halanaerobiales bacterium]